MKKLFTTVLCALAFLSASAQENTFSSNPQPKEIKSANHNTRGGSWRSYDDDQYVTGIGGPSTFAWGIMFPAETLSEGQNITKIGRNLQKNDGKLKNKDNRGQKKTVKDKKV